MTIVTNVPTMNQVPSEDFLTAAHNLQSKPNLFSHQADRPIEGGTGGFAAKDTNEDLECRRINTCSSQNEPEDDRREHTQMLCRICLGEEEPD